MALGFLDSISIYIYICVFIPIYVYIFVCIYIYREKDYRYITVYSVGDLGLKCRHGFVPGPYCRVDCIHH